MQQIPLLTSVVFLIYVCRWFYVQPTEICCFVKYFTSGRKGLWSFCQCIFKTVSNCLVFCLLALSWKLVVICKGEKQSQVLLGRHLGSLRIQHSNSRSSWVSSYLSTRGEWVPGAVVKLQGRMADLIYTDKSRNISCNPFNPPSLAFLPILPWILYALLVPKSPTVSFLHGFSLVPSVSPFLAWYTSVPVAAGRPTSCLTYSLFFMFFNDVPLLPALIFLEKKKKSTQEITWHNKLVLSGQLL